MKTMLLVAVLAVGCDGYDVAPQVTTPKLQKRIEMLEARVEQLETRTQVLEAGWVLKFGNPTSEEVKDIHAWVKTLKEQIKAKQ